MSMSTDNSHITVKFAGRPLHPLLRPLAPFFFFAACGCDLLWQASLFARNDSPEIASVAEWLLVFGLMMTAATALVALIDTLGDSSFRTLPEAGMYWLGIALAAAIELHNLDLRWTEGPEAVAPMGLILSASAVVVLVATPSRSWARLYR